MQNDIVAQGVELMVYGMGTVVVFLALLVVTTSLMSVLVTRYFPEPEPLPANKTPASATAGNDPQLVAVIAAAIQRHRARRR